MSGGNRPRFLTPSESQGGETMAQEQTSAAAAIALTPEQFAQLLAAAKSSQAGMTADDLAAAFNKASRPENTTSPQVSYYNPRGERDVPRPAFVAKKVCQNGLELTTDTLAWEEIEAINALPAGEWRVTKADGSPVVFKVQFTRGLDETTIERMDFHFPCRDEQREGHRPIFDYCIEVLEKAGKQDDADRIVALRKQLNKERTALKLM